MPRTAAKDSSLDLFFTYSDANGDRVTGKVDGDWTKEITRGTGTVTSTGVTVTEVDPANRKGLYHVDCASTSFTDTYGEYLIDIYETGSWELGHHETVIVTDDPDFDQALSSFTATAGDGRVTDGTNPIEDVSVIAEDSAGNRITETTTDSNGLYGPIFSDLSYTLYFYHADYQDSSASVTVSGTTATGPGADVAMSAATTTSDLLVSSRLAFARKMARDRMGTTTDTRLYSIINAAIQKVARATKSQWYRTTFDVELDGSYDTGNLILTSGSTTATLSGGTWPTNAAYGFISVGGKIHEIDTRDSGSFVTMKTSWQESGTTTTDWKWGRYQYDMDDDIYQIKSVEWGMNGDWGTEPVSWPVFQHALQTWTRFGTPKTCFCIANGAINLCPAPSDEDFVTMVGYRRPAKVTAAGQTIDVDPNHLELLNAAIEYYVCRTYKETEGGMTWREADAVFNAELADQLPMDRKHSIRAPPTARPRHGGVRRNLAAYRDVPDS